MRLHSPRLKWRMASAAAAPSGTSAFVEWEIDADTARLIRTAISLAREADSCTELDASASALPSMRDALRGRHSVRLLTFDDRGAATCTKLGLHLGSGRVYWESPLAAMQRAQGFISEHSSGRDDARLFRIPPTALQSLIVTCVGSAIARGALARPPLLSPESAVFSDFAAYEKSTLELAAVASRVAGGGPPWTREEQLRKLSRLETLASLALHKQHEGMGWCGGAHSGAAAAPALTEAETAVLAALEAGRRDLGMLLDE